VFTLIRTLANYRKQSSALTTGKFLHFLPVDGLYVYFRYDDKQTIMCVMNTADKTMPVDFSRYSEITRGFKQAKDILSGENLPTSSAFTMKPMTMRVFELK
jgi:glycosidase